ncbi:hypothetical protein GCM10009557_72730 [Virgisporangium ochraceum]|uniref:DUF4190 domain-containing protein n=1 Tax=Virgisporangium ochraceum TaxID=65505 RepID=A0A8J4EH88_9ACTN|nr:hypothetical protein [Virgisporangium ochraceum]GIJ71952.1 hypothetical protein Voc01_068690 [Virgisporangium ochraceum]
MTYPYGDPGPTRPGVAGGAVASLVLGVVAVLGICGMFVPVYLNPDVPVMTLVGAVLFVGLGAGAVFAGVAARRRIRVGDATGNGLAITGMVLGTVAIVVILFLQVVLLLVLNRYN